MNRIEVTFLGSGTSDGVPSIGCGCPVCRSEDPRDRRSRSSVLLNCNGINILIDTTTDIRAQALTYGIDRIDAVLYTHSHADHVNGIDELRSYNKLQKTPIPAFAAPWTVEDIKRRFYYLFEPGQTGGGKANIRLEAVRGPFEVCGILVRPLKIRHGELLIYGYRIFDFAYLSDCSAIPQETLQELENLDILVLDALRKRPHPTHFSLDEARRAAEKIGARQTFFTHICHEICHRDDSRGLPDGMELAFDGFKVSSNTPIMINSFMEKVQ